MRSIVTWASAGMIVAVLGLSFTSAEAQWGSIKGTVLAEGNLVPLPPLIAKGQSTRDLEVCAAEMVPDESKVIDRDTRGLANVAIWVATKPAKIHPNLEKSAKGTDVHQKGCRFIPHILSVRTDQVVNVFCDDGIAHITHTFPRVNRPESFVLGLRAIVGDKIKEAEIKYLKQKEKFPIKVTCDIHPWMEAYWVVLDHPYVAITNEKGEFEIADLPVGEHEIKVWQEKIGWVVQTKMVIVKEGVNEIPTITATFE